MYDTKDRVELVKNGVRRLRRRREKYILRGLSALCVLLGASLVTAAGSLAGFAHPTVRTFYGTVLLHEDAGGYVLVGVISFSIAVMITVLCIRLREREHRGQGTGKGNASQQREEKNS